MVNLHSSNLRCSKDSTLKIHPSPSGTERFSFRAFQFVKSPDKPIIYVHCKVLVCNASDYESRCATGCSPATILQRLKREVSTDVGYSLDEGPIRIINSKRKPPNLVKGKEFGKLSSILLLALTYS